MTTSLIVAWVLWVLFVTLGIISFSVRSWREARVWLWFGGPPVKKWNPFVRLNLAVAALVAIWVALGILVAMGHVSALGAAMALVGMSVAREFGAAYDGVSDMERHYTHREAFGLLHYQDEITGEIEVIWNSRDGVTPFAVRSRAGNFAARLLDTDRVCVPHHTPILGDRVFVDLTLARARELRVEYVNEWWDCDVAGSKMSDKWASKEEAIEDLAGGDFDPPPGLPGEGSPGQPDVIVVDDAFLRTLRLYTVMVPR